MADIDMGDIVMNDIDAGDVDIGLNVGADMGAGPPQGGLNFDPNAPPSPEQILSILDSLGLSDADKEQLRSELLYRQETGEFLPVGQAANVFSSQMIILAVMLTFLTLIFVFFGYKLYRSLTDKERKREEKRKLKQQKKKK